MKKRVRWMRLCLVMTLILSVTVSEAAGLPMLAPVPPSISEQDGESLSGVETPAESGSVPAASEENHPEEPTESETEPVNETEVQVTQMLQLRSAAVGSSASIAVGSSKDSGTGRSVESGLLLAKRLKKLAAEREFDRIVFRGSGFVNVRKEAYSESEPAGKMQYNAVARILNYIYQDDGLWYEIESGKVRGFVKSEFFVSGVDAMDLISELSSVWVEPKDDSQRLYEQASTQSVTLTTITNGVRYRSLGTEGGFTRVYVGENGAGAQVFGYVPTDRLDSVTDILTAVTAEDEKIMREIAGQVVAAQNSLAESREESRAEAARQASLEASRAASAEASRAEEARREAERAAAQRAADASRAEASRQASIRASEAAAEASRQGTKAPTTASVAPAPVNPGPGGSAYIQFIPEGTSALRRSIVESALSYVDVLPYVWLGESLNSGADCSGFCRAIYGQFGINVEHYTVTISKTGTGVSLENARPGDLVCYKITTDSPHVAIYIGSGYVVHSPRTGKKVSVNRVDYLSPITTIRNVIGD